MAAASSIHTSSACSSLWLSPGWMYWELKGGAGMKKEGQGEGREKGGRRGGRREEEEEEERKDRGRNTFTSTVHTHT